MAAGVSWSLVGEELAKGASHGGPTRKQRVWALNKAVPHHNTHFHQLGPM